MEMRRFLRNRTSATCTRYAAPCYWGLIAMSLSGKCALASGIRITSANAKGISALIYATCTNTTDSLSSCYHGELHHISCTSRPPVYTLHTETLYVQKLSLNFVSKTVTFLFCWWLGETNKPMCKILRKLDNKKYKFVHRTTLGSV